MIPACIERRASAPRRPLAAGCPHRITVPIAALLVWACCRLSGAADAVPPAPRPAAPGQGVLDLADGASLPGDLAPAPDIGAARKTLFWKAAAFQTPFEFSLDQVRGMRFAAAADANVGEWRVLLRDGDVLTGKLEAIDAERITIAAAGVAGPQRVRIARAEVDRIVRSAGAAGTAIFIPSGVTGWTQSPAESWGEESGGIATSRRGAAIERDIAATNRAVYDIVLTWKQRPEFRVAVSAAATGRAIEPYRMEMLGGDGDPLNGLMIVREEATKAANELLADVVPAGAAGRLPPRRLRVLLFVDQTTGRLAVVLPESGLEEPVVDVTIPPAKDAVSGLFRLTNGGDVCLASLRVTPWNEDAPVMGNQRETEVRGKGGRLAAGEVATLDAAAAELVVRGGAEPKGVPLADVEELVFAARETGDEGPAPPLRIASRRGQTLSGGLVKVDEEAVWILRRGIDEPIGLPRDEILAISSRTSSVPPPELPGRIGTLREEGLAMRGCIVPGPAGGLAWQPMGSVSSSPLAPVAASVEYVERKPVEPDVVDTNGEVGGVGGQIDINEGGFFVVVMMKEDGAAALDGRIQAGDRVVAIAPEKGSPFVETKGLDLGSVMNLLRGLVGTQVRLKVTAHDGTDPRDIELVRRTLQFNSPEMLTEVLATHRRLAPVANLRPRGEDGFPALVFLRAGDVLPCAVEAIDAQGVRIRTPGRSDTKEAIAIPATRVKAVELIPSAGSRGIERARLERLLTLPRLQRANPPTHVVRLVNGDYLRGRVTGLDDTTVRLVVLDETKTLPRSEVARVIWLHPEELEVEADTEPPARPAAEKGLLVQGVTADGGRVTLIAERVAGEAIHGESPAIGETAIDLRTIDRLLIGSAIDAETKDMPFRQWKLKPAAEPRALRERERKDKPDPGSAARPALRAMSVGASP